MSCTKTLNFKITNHSFQCLDELLNHHNVKPLSLNPHRTLSTSFSALGNLIVQTTDDSQFIKVFRETLESILQSILRNFPENIFWDFDCLVISMLRQALVAKKGADYFLKFFAEKIELLMDLFGNKSEIRFRYLHDFIYGFDWAKWVQKEPKTRNLIEPFNPVFLDYLLNRGQEIVQLICLDDRQYHQLSENLYRNPFNFSREPRDEIRLFTYLARQKLIPVAAWDWNVSPVWNKPFHQMREAISLELHLVKTN
jgi:hypothetical protein